MPTATHPVSFLFRQPRSTDDLDADVIKEGSSPETASNLQRSLQIDMKGLFGDAVGNMSISPTNRDLVLAAKRGLFIIDLQAPLEVPRFLPQGGTWDVADVQWNPHQSRSEYIVSTSCEKLLIWNLLSNEKTAIQHILRAHYRAITDINWHNTEPDTVASTGIDSWVWAWDLRQNPVKPAFGLSAFEASGTQVKWNRQNANTLASSHSDKVLIWDRRKGSLPVHIIRAHNSKIYGIDWSFNRPNEIVTCSLDRTIKIWDTNLSDEQAEPKTLIRANYPVWRARDLPFGDGILSLPQRGATSLHMWSHQEPGKPIDTFDGHTDVVKEFVWRHREGSDFQLITWSKDRTLRFWPVDRDKMERVGYEHVQRPRSGLNRSVMSYRNLPGPAPNQPAVSAPVGTRGILAEVRAPLPPRHSRNLVMQPHGNSSLRFGATKEGSKQDAIPIPPSLRRGGTMSRGNFGGRSVRQPDAFAWLSSVRVGNQRDGSSGASARGSKPNSQSRPPSGKRGEADTAGGKPDDRRDAEMPSLQEEITTVLTKLSSSKIKLEKHDLMKKRTCTLSLHGPWGESSSVFIRVTFTFPREYPRPGAAGTPSVDLERNPLISLRSRAFILRRLRIIRENRRPCLEACLRFLLFAQEDTSSAPTHEINTDSSSSEDEGLQQRRPKEVTVSLLRTHKNLAEPRTSQGYFSSSGHLVCFFRAPTRVVTATQPELISSPKPSIPAVPAVKPPYAVTDAILQLKAASFGRPVTRSSSQGTSGTKNMGQVITKMLTFSPHLDLTDARVSAAPRDNELRAQATALQNTVHIFTVANSVGPDVSVAQSYSFEAPSLGALCDQNAAIAALTRRYDHQRIFLMLRSLFPHMEPHTVSETISTAPEPIHVSALADNLIRQLYTKLSSEKDVQMLAMVSVVLLQASVRAADSTFEVALLKTSPETRSARSASARDYFSLNVRKDRFENAIISPVWREPSSPFRPRRTTSSGPSLKGARSISHGTGKPMVIGPEARKMSRISPIFVGTLPSPIGRPIPARRQSGRWATEHSPFQDARTGSDAELAKRAISKSWSDIPTMSESKSGPRPKRNLQLSIPPTRERVLPTFRGPPSQQRPGLFFTEPRILKQLHLHVVAYAKILLEWQLPLKRAELLKATHSHGYDHEGDASDPQIGLALHCPSCASEVLQQDSTCPSCSTYLAASRCSICRMTIRGISRGCARCHHITHVSCWRKFMSGMTHPSCPTGCGCRCNPG